MPSDMGLRPYQERAVAGVRAHWEAGQRSVCLVSPPGSGKTVMGAALSDPYRSRALWLSHTRELLDQAAERTGCTTATVQGLLATPTHEWPDADLLVLDEAHHYRAAEWGTVLERYPRALVLGLTGTPQRTDGQPLGDVFGALVVAASYSELLADGHLVPCDVWCPPESVERGVAQDALQAYQRHGAGGQAFVFWPGVQDCVKAAQTWPHSAAVTGATPVRERDAAVAGFRSGTVMALHTVQVLTEGVDVPQATVCVLARRMRSCSQYLQATARVLRPAPGKTSATLIDLCGSALDHGSPTEDRLYSLSGDAIRRTDSQPTLHQCLSCGWTWEGDARACPQCGYEPPVQERPKPRVFSLELRRLADVRDADDDQRNRELARLLDVTRSHGFTINWAVQQYKKLFTQPPPPRWLMALTSDEERRTELDRTLQLAQERGYKRGWALHAYQRTFGAFPRLPRR